MGDSELDPTVIKRTQDTLGKYVKKPPLTEKLLKKPPFRFLHDVFKAVIRETGYFDGLYNADELNFENIKDREDKMRFLQKMIDVVKLTTQRDLNVRTSKIVAGHEPEQTNELLQMMSEIIEQQMEWKSAVKTISNGVLSTVSNGQKEVAEVTVKKKESKGGDKMTKETVKGRPPKIRDAAKPLNKENRNSKNATPSPDEKTKKSIKAASTRTKEKSLARQTTFEKEKLPKDKEKVAKKSKDSTDKAKVLKTSKENSKRTSPASAVVPVKSTPTPSERNTMNGKLRQKSVESEKTNANAKDAKKALNEVLVKRDSKEILQDDDVLEKQTSINTNKNLTNLANGEILSPDSMGSRKSSAHDEQKSRHASAKNSLPPEELTINHAEQQQTTMDSTKALETANENDIHAKHTPPMESSNENELKNQQQPKREQQQSPKAEKTTKRDQPTFTHENSRDSVGSNSNSSTTTRPRTSLRPPSARPPSARPGAPRRRDKNVEIILQPNDPIKMSNINVKLESFGGIGDLDDDGENFVIIEDATSATTNIVQENKSDSNIIEMEQQGHLVQQILETQKELTQQDSEIVEKVDKADNSETAYDANARQSSARQMNNLRDIIQNLSKSVGPFGKLMDFIPEDIDAMQLELNMWRDAYSQAASDLKREKSLTESATEPMKNQLIGIEANIQEYMEMIDASRVKILQNYEKILKMFLEQ